MEKSKVLITGASGCVGQYISSWLLKNSNLDLYLLVRDPEKITAFDINNKRITLLIGDLREIKIFKEELKLINHVIHTATAWGDPKRAYDVNVQAVKDLLSLLNEEIVEKIIYFSTASILDENLNLIPEAIDYGTEYIQTKAICLKQLEKNKYAHKISAVFPTLVFGGRINNQDIFPTSYLTAGLIQALKWIWLARWIKAFSKFHFIHAADIAEVCGQMILNETEFPKDNSCSTRKVKRYVLAQPYVTIDEIINKLLRWKNLRRTPQIPLTNFLVRVLIKVLPIDLSSWDRFSIKQRHFVHKPITNPETLGKTSIAKSFEEVLGLSGLKRFNYSHKQVKIWR